MPLSPLRNSNSSTPIFKRLATLVAVRERHRLHELLERLSDEQEGQEHERAGLEDGAGQARAQVRDSRVLRGEVREARRLSHEKIINSNPPRQLVEPEQHLEHAGIRPQAHQSPHQRRQRPMALHGHVVLDLLLAQRGQLPVQHQLPPQGRAEAVVRGPGNEEGRRRPREGLQELPHAEDEGGSGPPPPYHNNVLPHSAVESEHPRVQAGAIPRR